MNLRLPAVALLAVACLAFAPDDESALLELVRRFESDKTDLRALTTIFNDHQGTLEKATASGKVTPAQWQMLRDGKLKVISNVARDFLGGQQAPKFGAFVTRLDHMGTSGTVTQYTPTSDCDLRPNHAYHGIDADIEAVAKANGIKNLKSWNINILSPTDVSSVEKFLKEQRNPEKYALKGALAFLEHTQYTTNVTEVAEIVNGKPVYKGKIAMNQSGAPAVAPPNSIDALDYMVEMRMRAHGDLDHMVQLGAGQFSADDADTMKSFRRYAKDLYKYVGTRAVGEALGVTGVDLAALDPEVAARLRDVQARAPRIKENINELGHDPQKIMRESRQMAKDLDALLDAVYKAQVRTLAEKNRALPALTAENAAGLQGRLNELTEMKMRMAMQIIRGGPEVEALQKKYFQDHPELWKDLMTLKEYAQLELDKTAKGLRGPYARRADIERAHRATADRFLDNVLRRLREEKGIDIDTSAMERRLRRNSAPAPSLDPPGLDKPPRGAASLYEKYANSRLESWSPRWKHVRGAKYWIPEIADVMDAAWDDWENFSNGEWIERVQREVPDFKRMPGNFLAGLTDWQRSEIRHSLSETWKALRATDRDLIKSGRSYVHNIFKVEGMGDAIGLFDNLKDLWTIAYATYHDGWDGFILSSGEFVQEEAVQAVYVWFVMKAAPFLLERVGLSNLAGACPGIGQALLTGYMAYGLWEMFKAGVDAAVDYFIKQGFRDEQIERLYGWHAEGSKLREEGFGFFDKGRQGWELTPATLWSGNARRAGYADPKDLITAVRKHRANLRNDNEVFLSEKRFVGEEGMRLWAQIEERALNDWCADVTRKTAEVMNEVKRRRGELKTADIDALPATSESKPVFARVVDGTSGTAERVGNRWRTRASAVVATAAMPGTRTKIRLTARVEGTDIERTMSTDVVRGEGVDPRDLLDVQKLGFEFEFDAAGERTVVFTLADEGGRTLDTWRHTLGVALAGTIDELTVEASQTTPFRAVEELRAGETAYALVTDRITGFDAVERKSVEVWLADAQGRKVAGAAGSAGAPRTERGVEVAFAVPATLAPGEYALVARETIWRVEREARARVRIGAVKPRFSNFRCIVSDQSDGRRPTSEFLRGDDLFSRVEFDAQYAPPGTTASVRFVARREGGRSVEISGGSFAVSDGANGWTRPGATRVGANATASPWTVTAIVDIAGEEFTAQTSFRITDQTLRLTNLYCTWGMQERTASTVFALGDTVWALAEYKLAAHREQTLLVVWETQRPGADGWTELSRSAVPVEPGDHTAMRALPVGRDPKVLGAHRIRVTLRADAQEPVTAEVDVEVKRAIEWSNPPLVAGWANDAAVPAPDFRCGEPFAAVMRFRLNVDNGRKFRFDVKTYDPQGREYRPCSGSLAPQAIMLGERLAWVPAALPTQTDQLPEGRYTVVARVWSNDDMIEERTTFDVHVPARIHALKMCADDQSGPLKNQFKPGEVYGVFLDYEVAHVRPGEKASLTMRLYQEGFPNVLAQWGDAGRDGWAWDAAPQRSQLRVGGRMHAQQVEGRYFVQAELVVGNFRWTERAPLTVGIFPDIVITAPVDRSETRDRVINVTGTIADRRIQRAGISLNGHGKALAVNNGAFSERMVLRPGWNQITVTAQNALATDTKTVWVNANIPAALVKIVLDWSENASDVDLWVIDPQGVTTSFGNKQPRPDRNLDIDNTSGYGPETYTCFNWDMRGDYTVIVKYYADSGARQVGTHVRWTLYEGTQWERGSETQWITLDHAAGSREEQGASYRFKISVP